MALGLVENPGLSIAPTCTPSIIHDIFTRDSSTGSQHTQGQLLGAMPSSLYLLFTLLGLYSAHTAAGRTHASLIPEDPHAFPKFDVTFLNGLPVLNETAERWLSDGLQGGLLEFLEEPWVSKNSPWSKLKGIDPTEVFVVPSIRPYWTKRANKISAVTIPIVVPITRPWAGV